MTTAQEERGTHMGMSDEVRKDLAECEEDEPCRECVDTYCPLHPEND